MVQFNLSYDQNISLEQRVAYEVAANILKSFITDDTVIDIHFVGTSGLNDGNAVGGAVPIFHRVNYGVLAEYIAQDASSHLDEQGVLHLQNGNTVDLSAYGEVIDGNTEIILTKAQAEALGMDEALLLETGTTWDRDVVDTTGLDGYILVNQDFEWNNDVLRSGEAPEGTLDSLSMALHEMLHIMGFVSGIDGTIAFNQLLSGQTEVEGATLLDLFRYSTESAQIENPDGSVSTITEGESAYLSADGGLTSLGDFSTGQGGDGYQASHWKRMQVALGLMDPTLAYQEQLSLAERDLQALDLLGWDVDYSVLGTDLNMRALLLQAEQTVAASFGLDGAVLTEAREAGEVFTLGFSEWWALFEDQIIEMGFSEWWQVLEAGYDTWEEFQDDPEDMLELGFSEWWQSFESTILDLGFSEWWQTFETNMLNLGFSEWWQVLELGFSEWWQQLETYFSTLDTIDGNAAENQSKRADGGVRGKNAKIYRGGENDDIIAGDKKQDRIKAGAGDDLIDGKGGHDVIWGEAGEDIIYGQDGNDLLYGGDGDDLLLGEADNDELHGEAGHDILSGGSGDDIASGGEGKDDLKGGWGKDVLDGGEGNDLLRGEAGSDVLIGGEGQDQLQGGGGDDVLYGDAYDGDASLKQLSKQLKARATESESENTSTLPADTDPLNPVRIEAEDMTLTGDSYIYTTWSNDSGDSVRTTGASTATTTFSGQSGEYMVVLRYFDEEEGNGELSISMNGTPIENLVLNQNTDRYYTRIISQNLTINNGDEFTIAALKDGKDEAAFDYLEFIPLNNLIETSLAQTSSNDTSNSSTTNSSDAPDSTSTTESVLRVEAESMTLVGDYYAEDINSASGGAVISVRHQGEGKALSTLAGESGYYDIVVGYYDENDDGIGRISASLNNVELDAWWLDQILSSDTSATAQNFATRTVASSVFLQAGDIFELTGVKGAGELARVDYVDFVRVDLSQEIPSSAPEAEAEVVVVPSEPVAPSEPVVIGDAIRVEAESMNLSGGYYVENDSNPSGGQLIRTNGSGTATTQFSGDSGYYNIVVAYYDENDGLATISASLGGIELDSWQLNQSLNSNYISSSNRVTRTIATQLRINAGDELSLNGLREQGEHARIDYVEFVPVSAPVGQMEETSQDDFLEGGAGNDIVYGGEGNDVLYGEFQNDRSNRLLQGTHTYNGHTYLFSDVGTWSEAQIQAQQLGGNLVTLNNAEEETWVRATFGSSNRLWIGINDVAVEGQFEWVSGEAVTYTNWEANEPNNDGGGQDYGTINYRNQWDDIYHGGFNNYGFRGIIEINTTDNDVLVGGSGSDVLYGNGGDDSLYGDEQTEQVGNGTLGNGLVAHWTFDETTGTQAIDTIGNHAGDLRDMAGSEWTTEGQVEGALYFDGSNDYVEVGDSSSFDITDTLTLATWVKADTFESWDGLIVKGTSQLPYALNFRSDGRLILQTNYGFSGGGRTFSSNASLTAGQWQHVAVTYDGSNVQFYIDGQLDSTESADITFETNNESLILGRDFTGSHLDGALDDARVYNRALSIEEVEQLATGEVSVQSTGTGGNDFLYGGAGNDTLEGGAGNDVLEGTDAIAAGSFEQDILGGGLGSDTFVVGNASQSYYIGMGNQDFALIKDFNAAEDTVQLHGSVSDYTQQQQGNDTYLYYQGDTSDLVAVFKNIGSVNFNTGFTFT